MKVRARIGGVRSVAIVVAMLALRESAFAFMPWDPGHGSITQDSLCGYQSTVCPENGRVADDCSEGITRTIDNEVLKFTNRARSRITRENQRVDYRERFFGVGEHFDDEHFIKGDSDDLVCAGLTNDGHGCEGGSDRLLRLKGEVIEELAKPRPSALAARSKLGQALHTLQDFYAHSNWVETLHTSINRDLGLHLVPRLPKSTATCNADGGDAPVVMTGITTGYFSLDPLHRCDFPAGKCRHGIAGCSTGLNKDSPSRPNYCKARNLAVEATTDYVNQILDAPGVAGNRKAIATLMGAKTFAVLIDDSCPMGWYYHGGGELFAGFKEGIKSAASSLQTAIDKPTRYVLSRFNDTSWGPPLITSNLDEFLHAVDQLSPIPCNWNATPRGCLFPNKMRDHSQLALKEVVPKLDDGDKVFVFVYGVPPAAELGEAYQVSQQAHDLGITIDPVLLYPYDSEGDSCPGVTGPHVAGRDFAADNIGYENNARITGGQKHLVIGPGWDGSAEDLSRFTQRILTDRYRSSDQIPRTGGVPVATSSGADVLLLRADGTFDSRTSVKDFFLPIDSSIEHVKFAALQTGTVSVFRPSGARVAAGDAGVIVGGGSVTIDDPEPGQWHMQVASTGNILPGGEMFSASVEARSSIDLAAFDFVAFGGRPEHEGYFPVPGHPIAGTLTLGRATLLGPYATAAFQLVYESGATISNMGFVGGVQYANAHEFIGQTGLPSVPFRVAAVGTDMNGFWYRRIFPGLFKRQRVKVEEDNAIDDIRAGTTTSLSFKVTNFGMPDTFNIVAVDDLGFISGVQPSSLTLDAGASGEVHVHVTVPAATVGGQLVSMSVGATSTTDPSGQNSISSFHGVSGCGKWQHARVVLTHTLSSRLTIRGQFTLPSGTSFADFDPSSKALRMIVENAHGEFAVDATIPAGLDDGSVGWSNSRQGWKYRNKADPSTTGGFSRLLVRDRSKTSPGLVGFLASGRSANYAIGADDMPLAVTVVLNEGTACGRVQFTPERCRVGRQVTVCHQ